MIVDKIIANIAKKYKIDEVKLRLVDEEVQKKDYVSSADFRECISLGLPFATVIKSLAVGKDIFVFLKERNIRYRDFIAILCYIDR